MGDLENETNNAKMVKTEGGNSYEKTERITWKENIVVIEARSGPIGENLESVTGKNVAVIEADNESVTGEETIVVNKVYRGTIKEDLASVTYTENIDGVEAEVGPTVEGFQGVTVKGNVSVDKNDDEKLKAGLERATGRKNGVIIDEADDKTIMKT